MGAGLVALFGTMSQMVANHITGYSWELVVGCSPQAKTCSMLCMPARCCRYAIWC